MHKAGKAHFALRKYLRSTLFSRRTKVRLYGTFGNSWAPSVSHNSTTGEEAFENNILRKVCGPVSEPNVWRKRKNVEFSDIIKVPLITNYIEIHRLQ